MNADTGFDRAECLFIEARQFGRGFDFNASLCQFPIERIEAKPEFLVPGRWLKALVQLGGDLLLPVLKLSLRGERLLQLPSSPRSCASID